MQAPHILILGGTSDMALALARAYAGRGAHLTLAARNPERLDADIADLRIRGAASARHVACDILHSNAAAFVDALGTLPDVVICAVGLLGDQAAAENNAALAQTILRSNFEGPTLMLGEFANHMEVRGAGSIIGVSSVAGDRGRASNYLYGSAKAGFTAFLSGLRNRLASKGVHVMTVKPGFVNTRMTAGMNLPKLLTAQPEEVARAIIAAADRRRNTIYVYPIWRLIMLIIAHIPEAIFKKMHL
jgi:decaprenylphospho-beta-D-erythro-pentofuranosid-2-ulose 2-reductase